METKTVGKKTYLPEKKRVKIIPNMERAKNILVTDKEHENYFLLGAASRSYSLPMDSRGGNINPFESEEQRQWIEGKLGVDLNPYKRTDNFFHTYEIFLNKEEKFLDLSDPSDLLFYLVAKANHHDIVPTTGSMASLKVSYGIVSLEYEEKAKASKADLMAEAYSEFIKIRDNKEDMLNFLTVYGKRVDPNSKIDFLKATINDIVNSNPEQMIALLKDKQSFAVKLLINRAVAEGHIVKNKDQYFLPGGDPLSTSGYPTLDRAVEYLSAARNSDILESIKARLG